MRNYWHITSAALALLGQIAAAAPPAAPAPLVSDRPGFTNSSEVVGPGVTQLEAGVARTTTSFLNGGGQTTDLPQATLRRGLTQTLELRIGLPDYFSSKTNGSGFGDGSLGLKWKFYQSKNGNTKVALTPSLVIPSRQRVYSSGQYDPAVTLGAQTVSGARWGVSTNLTLSNPTVNGQRLFTVSPSAAVSYQITQALSAYGDVFDSFPKQSLPTPIADGGFTYLVTPNLQLDAETGIGLGGSAPVRFYSGGVAIRF